MTDKKKSPRYNIRLLGFQIVTCVSIGASCETSTSKMLRVCTCRFSTCNTYEDHI
jgi:hypothetical protein